MTISEFITNIPHEEPNNETQKAMNDVDERKNLTCCKTIEEFWKEIGINSQC